PTHARSAPLPYRTPFRSYAEVRARGHSRLLEGIQDRVNGEKHGLLDVWMSHGDKVTALPPGFKVIASNETTPIALKPGGSAVTLDRKSTRLNSSHGSISS